MSDRQNSRIGAPSKGQRGFALLLVIWAVSLLTVLATMLLAETRNDAYLVRNNLEAARASAFAEAGVAIAIEALVNSGGPARWSADGTPHEIAYGGGRIVLRMVDENGKIDLNLSPVELIGGLFARAGMADDVRAEVLAEITRRRQEIPQQAALNLLPSRAPILATQPRKAFYSVDDLLGVPGLTRAVFDRVRPFLTVNSQSGRINPLTAPREVLLSIPGVNPLEVEALLAARDSFGTALNPGSLPPVTGGQQYLGPGGRGGAIMVTSTGFTAGGTVFTREAIVGVAEAPLQPYRILEWRQPPEAVPAVAQP